MVCEKCFGLMARTWGGGAVNSGALGGRRFAKGQPGRRPKDPVPREMGYVAMPARSWLGGQ